jgi:Secretory lipase
MIGSIRQHRSSTLGCVVTRELLSHCGCSAPWHLRLRGVLAACFAVLLAFALPAARAQDFVPQTEGQSLAFARTATPAQALAFEKADRMPATSFYDTSSPLSPGSPGQLIRSQAVEGYALPRGVRAIRILYHSRGATGKDAPASGVVLVPPGPSPEGGWPVIAWAHGTSGVARICAPSMMKDVYYGTEGLFPMVQAGFAVVAVDYAGLGTDVPHQYANGDAQANDVINGVRAAHAAVGRLSSRWVVDGHSQGGGAAWFVAQQEAVLRDPNYLGAVSVAGIMSLGRLVLSDAVNSSDSFYAVYQAYGIKAIFPQFNVADMLTKAALAQYDTLTTKACWYYGNATQLSGVFGKSAVKPHFADNPWVRKYWAMNATFQHRPRRPLLLLAGGADRTVPPQLIRQVAAKACRLGYRVQLRVFPGLDHDPLMYKSTPYQLRWISARFAGRPAPDNCATLVKR